MCFWTCHSYCPKECCYNPFQCNTVCRTFCTPYCSDRCCAPGSRRLPKLALNFQKTSAETGKEEEKEAPTNQDKKIQQVKTQLTNHYEAIKQASAYATRLLGLPQTCPLFCSKVCAPGLCKADCCRSTILQGQGSNLASLPAYPNPSVSITQGFGFPQISPAPGYSMSQTLTPGSLSIPYCPTPIDCPPGGVVDPDYCPPICRTSCIEQCPNECCPNYGRPAVQPKH